MLTLSMVDRCPSFEGSRDKRFSPPLDANGVPCGGCPTCNQNEFWRWLSSIPSMIRMDGFAGSVHRLRPTADRATSPAYPTTCLAPRGTPKPKD
jgi:hypothetical protein